jgi:ABC-type lipoprotein export system ATPase subunit
MRDNNALFRRSGDQVSVSNLHKSYQVGDEIYRALDNVSCTFPSGQVTAVQGPSGCGKTTLMNIIGGVDSADRGSIMIGSRNLVEEQTERQLSRYRLTEVGFVFQAFNLIPGLTALDNLSLPMTVLGIPRAEREARAQALLELVGMGGKSEKRPDELSGGEQQRVATALALVNDPPLIIADEPTGNLDSNNSRVVTDLLVSLAHDLGKTVVITTHDPVVGDRGDRRLQMRDGAIVDAS